MATRGRKKLASGLAVSDEADMMDTDASLFKETDDQVEIQKGIPLEVFVEGDNIEKALKALKRKLVREGVFKEFKAKRYFEKPSQARKRKRNEIKRKIEKIERERLSALQLIK